ncbi:hypothetical protein Tco_0658682, partial [Tanacetum coccineum]
MVYCARLGLLSFIAAPLPSLCLGTSLFIDLNHEELVVVLGRWFGKKNHGKGRFDFGGYGDWAFKSSSFVIALKWAVVMIEGPFGLHSLHSYTIGFSRPIRWVKIASNIWSDHNPILLHCKKSDFGPIPFKLFHSWFSTQDFDDTIKAAWNDALNTNSPKPVEKKAILASLRALDIKTDAGQASEEEETLRVNTCVINSRRNTQRILGILHEGVWISDPNAIKYAFLNFYKENFACHDSLVNFSPLMATNRLSDSDHVYLDAVVSFKEIKHAVWDCGSQKAPG